MLLQIFKPLESDAETLEQNKIGDISQVLSYRYKRYWQEVGDFTLVIPAEAPCAGEIEPDMLLFIDGDWLIVTGVKRQDKELTVTGADLKGYLAARITLYGAAQDAGAQGYDVVQGTTEYVLKHYIDNNLVNPADVKRRIPGMAIAPNQGRGLAQDTYMARMENLAELAGAVCKNGKLGYDIAVDQAASRFVFDVLAPVDKSEGQNKLDRVVFSLERGNVLGLTRETSAANYKNAFYATKTNGNLVKDAMTKLVIREGAAEPSGPRRREVQVNVSADSAGEIDLYARKEAQNYIMADSFDVSAQAAEEYGKAYTLGDIVTVKDQASQPADKLILAAEKSYTPTERTVSLTLGEKYPKPLNALNNKAEQAKYDVKNALIDKPDSWDVRQTLQQTLQQAAGLTQQLTEMMANSMGTFTTTETLEDGSTITYQHNKPTLAESDKIWKKTADAFAVSTDGGKTWNAGVTAAGNLIAKVIESTRIQSPSNPNVYFDLLNGKIGASEIIGNGGKDVVSIGYNQDFGSFDLSYIAEGEKILKAYTHVYATNLHLSKNGKSALLSYSPDSGLHISEEDDLNPDGYSWIDIASDFIVLRINGNSVQIYKDGQFDIGTGNIASVSGGAFGEKRINFYIDGEVAAYVDSSGFHNA